MAGNPQAKTITPRQLPKLQPPLPRALIEAAGMLKGKRQVHPLRYQRQIRREWEKRLQKLYRSPHP